MKTIEIYEITIKDVVEASKNINYPNSGLFIVRTESMSDLRFIDKTTEFNWCITPTTNFYSVVELNQTNELISEPVRAEKYDANFILEFSRILLNRK